MSPRWTNPFTMNDRIWIDAGVGDYVVDRAPLGWFSGVEDIDVVSKLVNTAVTLEPERNEEREFAFGLRQIVDIGVKALSPGINDPSTAIVSLNVATRTLASAAETVSADTGETDGASKVVVPQPSWSELVFSTFDQLANYGCGDVQVCRAIVSSVKRLVTIAPSSASTDRLRDTLDSISLHVAASYLAPSEREAIEREVDDCRRLLRTDPSSRVDRFRPSQRTSEPVQPKP